MTTRSATPNISSTFLRIGRDASIERLAVGETFWSRLANGDLGGFEGEFLVSSHAIDSDWGVWEMHPNGDELVCLLSGEVTFVLERDGGREAIEMTTTGDFVIVPRGTWHTARCSRPSTMLFVTAGEGTEHRMAE